MSNPLQLLTNTPNTGVFYGSLHIFRGILISVKKGKSEPIMLENLRKTLLSFNLEEGVNKSNSPRINLYKESTPTICPKCMYDPALIFVAQGEKHSFLSKHEFVLTPNRLLLVSLPLPMKARVIGATPDTPFLALTVTIDMVELGELLQELPRGFANRSSNFEVIKTASLTPEHENALGRLGDALKDPEDSRVMAPSICRELVYYTLKNDEHGAFQKLIQTHGAKVRVGRIIEEIHRHPERQLNVPELAEQAQMSKSSFFALFKELTAHSPIQYQKSVRLHRARVMIVTEGRMVSEAAYSVGYSTASQFSRDYARFFNITAKDDLARAYVEP